MFEPTEENQYLRDSTKDKNALHGHRYNMMFTETNIKELYTTTLVELEVMCGCDKLIKSHHTSPFSVGLTIGRYSEKMSEKLIPCISKSTPQHCMVYNISNRGVDYEVTIDLVANTTTYTDRRELETVLRMHDINYSYHDDSPPRECVFNDRPICCSTY